MRELMAKLLAKKNEDGDMSPEDVAAKMDVLKELLHMASAKQGEDVHGGMQKLMVAAPDKNGLKAGMHKAEDMLDHMSKEDESPEEEASESPAQEEGEEQEEMNRADELHMRDHLKPEDVRANQAEQMFQEDEGDEPKSEEELTSGEEQEKEQDPYEGLSIEQKKKLLRQRGK